MKSSSIYTLFIIIASIQLSLNLFNPGILVTVPFPLQPPHVDLHLPINIDPILVNSLQLNQINLKSVQYTWSFSQTTASIKISDALVLFDWKFKSDQGQGTFQQSQYQIDFQYKFIQNNKNRIEINIISSKSKLGHSTVHLGGATKQTVIVQVTNLILNHAAIIFRKTIEKAISSAIQSFSSIFDHDPKLICPVDTIKCVYLNSTLVSPPIISNKTLLIQLNGASYINGQSSTQLNPQTALVKTNSSKIQGQIHVKSIQQIVTKAMSLIPQRYLIDVSSKFTTFDLTSLTISPVFPLMALFEKPRFFNIQLSKLKLNAFFNQQTQTIDATIEGLLNVFTNNYLTSRYDQYLRNPCAITGITGLKIIYGWKGLSVRIDSLKLNSFECDQEDVNQNYVDPEAFLQVRQTMMVFLRTGINGGLNRKVINLEFNGIQAVLNGKILNQQAVLDLTLNSALGNESTQNSSFKVILEE